MSKTSYIEKLKDPRWQRKRTEILRRDNFTCQSCGSTTTTLNVHHKKYGPEPWDIEDKYLVTLCEDCHEIEGDMMKEYYDLFIETFKSSPLLADDLRELASGLNSLELHTSRRLFVKALAYVMGHPEGQSELIRIFNDRVQQQRNGETING